MKFARSLTTTAMSMASSSSSNVVVTRNGGGKPTTLRGVVFDMDGTLTKPNLDFASMYRQCQVDPSADILVEIANMPPERAAACRAVIDDMEEQGRQTLQLQPGTAQVLSWLAAQGIPTALVTRNTQATVDRLQELLLLPVAPSNKNGPQQQALVTFDLAIPRDDGRDFPPKPHPASLQYIVSERWQVVDPTTVVMVGDSYTHDVLYGQAAGTTTALLDTTAGQRVTQSIGQQQKQPDFLVQHLWQLPRLLWLSMHLDGPLGHDVPPLKYDTPMPSSLACQAAAAGQVDRLQAMTAAEILHTCPTTGNTPLIWAANEGHEAAVAYILQTIATVDNKAKVDDYINVRGYLGATAVSRAACRGHAACLALLAAAGAQVDVCNDKLQYPLHFAAFKQHAECVQILLDHGADTLVLDRKGRTPSMDTSSQEIRQLLQEYMM